MTILNISNVKETKHKSALSASRIKKLQGCSWLYWTTYHLKLPDEAGLGAKLGNICHTVFETLGNPKHRKHYNKIIKKGKVNASKAVKRLVIKHCRKLGIGTKEDLIKLGAMIVAGLKYDFYGETLDKPTEKHSELKFDLSVENEKEGISYRIGGFIDKLFLYKQKSTALIRDFKSSKKMFEGKDVEDNIQAQIYSIAIKKIYPDYLKNKVEFAFLQFMEPDKPETGIVGIDLSDNDESDGFEYVLTELQKYVDGFSKVTAYSNFAKNQSFPTDGSFSGRLTCGFDTHKNQLKKDGTPMWGCSQKWPYDYYCVKDKNGKIKKTYTLDNAESIEYNEEDGETLTIEHYAGCPAWNK